MDTFDHNMGSTDCECEDERPNVTRQRLNGVNFPSLKSMSSRTILASLERIPREFLSDIPRVLQCYLLEKLETVNSRKLTKWDMDVFVKFEDEARCRKTLSSLNVLVGPECTEFCVDWLLVLCPGDKVAFLCEVLNLLVEKAPNLRKLIIGNVERDEGGKSFGGDQLDWPLNPYDGVGKPLLALGKSLSSLTLNLTLRSDELVLIGRHLPNLDFLKIASILCQNMNELQQATLEMMSNLHSLDHFDFNKVKKTDFADPPLPDSAQFNLFCLTNFPRLQTISRDGYLPLYRWGHLDLPEDCKLTNITVVTDEQWFKSLDSNPFLNLPNIIELSVKLNQFYGLPVEAAFLSQLEKLMHFPRLRALSIGLVPPPQIMDLFLNSYGRNLLKMELEIYKRSNVHVLHQLSTRCPNLQELHLWVFSPPVEQCLMHASPGGLSSLKTLHLTHFESQECAVECILQAAPNLQKLQFKYVVLTRAEGQRLSSLVRSHRICSQLTSLTLIGSWSQDEYNEGKMKAMSEFALDLCAFSPRLVDVTYRFDDYQSFDNYPDLADALKKFKDCCLQRGLNVMDNFQFM